MKKRLNVMIFSPLALEDGRGGEISSIELASGLHKYYHLTLIDTNISLSRQLLTQESILKKLKGAKRNGRIRFATLNIFNKIFTFPYPWEILKLYKKIKENNLIYTSCFTIKTNLLIIFFSLVHRRAKFIIGHRKPLYSEKIFSLYNLKYRISILLFSLLKKRFYHHTISNHAKKFLENFFEPDKIVHIIHGIEIDNFIKINTEEKKEDTLDFIYVGYLDNIHKGLGVLLKGIEKTLEDNKNCKIIFEFCGKGPLEEKLRELENIYSKCIKYYGYIDYDKIPKFYNKNDVFLFSSRREPFGRVIIEALASNLIIICSKTIGSVEILKGKEFAFFVKDFTPESFQRKIYEVYDLWKSDPIKFKKLQSSARNFAIRYYSISKEIEMFKDLFDSIIKID
ncbi:MAG: glycosyltransferase family 4 protein [Promethearchaeota archaeon]